MVTVTTIFVILGWAGAWADFGGLRRPPVNWNTANGELQQKQDEEQKAFMAQIDSFIETQARIRLLQHLAQLSREKALAEAQPADADPPFGFTPNDPRYFLPDFSAPKPTELYNKLKAPMDVNPKAVPEPTRPATTHAPSVVQKPINMDDSIGVYMVAMIAGISAAFTVASIAIGLAWYTLRQRIKAAADIEYPAYGVTGPNKELMDKKFAQNVDMYHYQQQKQKKLSLEKQSQGGETNDGFSDLEGEYDGMEDGDYTVYECPGFAPTGEMEVKNPLFADEPITVAQKHQPAAAPKVEVPSEKPQPKDISPEKPRTQRKKKSSK